jgi:hypothetical protein
VYLFIKYLPKVETNASYHDMLLTHQFFVDLAIKLFFIFHGKRDASTSVSDVGRFAFVGLQIIMAVTRKNADFWAAYCLVQREPDFSEEHIASIFSFQPASADFLGAYASILSIMAVCS